jgi:hypothetical protein
MLVLNHLRRFICGQNVDKTASRKVVWSFCHRARRLPKVIIVIITMPTASHRAPAYASCDAVRYGGPNTTSEPVELACSNCEHAVRMNVYPADQDPPGRHRRSERQEEPKQICTVRSRRTQIIDHGPMPHCPKQAQDNTRVHRTHHRAHPGERVAHPTDLFKKNQQ